MFRNTVSYSQILKQNDDINDNTPKYDHAKPIHLRYLGVCVYPKATMGAAIHFALIHPAMQR